MPDRTAEPFDVSRLADELQRAIGQRLVAYAVGVRSPQAVGRWARGERVPRPKTVVKLMDLYGVYLVLSETERDEMIVAWLLGGNPHLGENAPIELLREGDDEPVLSAAIAFVLDA
jgi:hypothetical protein